MARDTEKHRYRKVAPAIWNDERFRSLSPLAQLAFLFVLTHPQLTPVGAMRATVEGLSSELAGPQKDKREDYRQGFGKAFREVISIGMVQVDEEASIVWAPNFLRYNPPESANVVTAWAKSVEYLPQCALTAAVFERAEAIAKAKGEAFWKAYDKAFRKTTRIQKTENRKQKDINTPPNPPVGGNVGGGIINHQMAAENPALIFLAGAMPVLSDRHPFSTFWSAYPKKERRLAAMKAWNDAIVAGHDPAAIIAGIETCPGVVCASDVRKVINPEAYLTGCRWLDEPATQTADAVAEVDYGFGS